ncbi:MAG: transporter substrate-binding domain-containing protein [Candidatus Binatia bacterium]|nr:transporter substrate-binding domain-containing protein [Candidatus Binatia bacterium]
MQGKTVLEGRPRRVQSVRKWLATLLAVPAVALGGDTAGAKELRVGISESYAPLAFSKDGKPTGAEADLALAVGKILDSKIVFVPMKFPDLVPALEAGKVEVVMSGLSITEERSKKVLFTDPYLRVGQMALIRADDLGRSVDPDEIGAKESRVGVKKGTTGEGWAKKNVPDATVVGYDTVEAGTAALKAGDIDYFVHDAPTVWRLTGRPNTRDDALAGIYRPLTKEYLAWAVRAGDEKLAGELNGALKTLRADGQLRAILDVWIPVTKVAVTEGSNTGAPQPTAAPAVAE